MSQKPCHFFNTPGGCRRRNACSFLHDGCSSYGYSSSPPSPPSSAGPGGRQREPNCPSGVCSFYWSSGRCNREFNCRYKHLLAPTASPASSSARPQINIPWSPPSAVDAIAPFLTEAGLAKLNGNGTDIFFPNPAKSMSPSEAHNSIKRYLFDDFRFSKATQVYGFLIPLSNANSSNSTWSAEDGQLFLTSIATGNGLLRIDDIIRWEIVSPEAGSDSRILSFQRGYLPLLRFFSSDFVVRSTLSHLVNSLYLRIIENSTSFCDNLEKCMNAIMHAQSFKDLRLPNVTSTRDPLGSQVIASLTGVFFECLTRFKNVASTHPRFLSIVRSLQQWTDTWTSGISSSPPTFDDPFRGVNSIARDHIIGYLKTKVDRLTQIVNREQAKLDRSQAKTTNNLSAHLASNMGEGIIAALRITYDGPGELSSEGKRHDNDLIDIQDIRVAPTREELISRTPPFLPANLYEAPHPLRKDSMERLLDIQFRLLREELIAPLRTSIQLVRDDLLSLNAKNHLQGILKTRGGKYRGHVDVQDTIIFNVYTGVVFSSVVPDRRGLAVCLSFDSPPGRARSPLPRDRRMFWEGLSGKRMMQGGLIALVWKRGQSVDVHLAILASSVQDLIDSAKASEDRVSLRAVFFDPDVELRILHTLEKGSLQDSTILLVEAPIMFEAIRPFLEALRAEPETIPFAQYLVHRPSDFLSSVEVNPPQYARMPGFSYQLAPLFPVEAGVHDFELDPNNPDSITRARHELHRSRLDPSQAEAVVDALVREVALIQGPPGTGKSFTGVELLRVLIKSAKPILMIAFTNHALDHIMTGVLDAGITDKIVRLGGRSTDERISKFSIENLEVVAGQSRLDKTFARNHRDLKIVQGKINALMKNFTSTVITSEEITDYLSTQYPELFEHFLFPPRWISIIHELSMNQEDDWQRVGKHNRDFDANDASLYTFWMNGRDLEFLSATNRQRQPAAKPNEPPRNLIKQDNKFSVLHEAGSEPFLSDDDDDDDDDDEIELWQRTWGEPVQPLQPLAPAEDDFTVLDVSPSPPPSASPPSVTKFQITDLQDPERFLAAYGHQPQSPRSDRSLDELFARGAIWTLSASERKRLHEYWSLEIREATQQNKLNEFTRLRDRYRETLEVFNEGKNETRRQLLRNVDIVACTTTGAAKLTSLLKGLSPRIMLVEEAGQVLEAHVLGSLVPSVEHLILIGDPQQLRPTLNNYALSMDNKRGRELYKFDMSLMERLSSVGFPMSQIDVQRRMRPMISGLIRKTLYPRLIDHELVKNYPSVRGFAKDVFFLDHTHRENGGIEESASRHNIYEVEMIRDLVLYLLRQGCYSQEGDIVVLCAYLGQLAKVRDALSDVVAVVIDERDQADLADHEGDRWDSDDTHVEHVKVSKRVRLRTVDNYQGEEAKIVILSLVRNAGSPDEEFGRGISSTIGFLKSDNRTNVALSRAKEGLFILGNGRQLASKSRMWSGVIEELQQQGNIGDAFPVACHRHPESTIYVSEPGKLPQVAPDGGCLKSCDFRLKCGHVCPYKCHPDDVGHNTVICSQPCRRLCTRRHPCRKECAQPCGKCTFGIADVELPCGHISSTVPCHLLNNLEEVYCNVCVEKQLPMCEHTSTMRCSDDPSQHICKQPCNGIMACCGKDCKSDCHRCQEENTLSQDPDAHPGRILRTKHMQHQCRKLMHCAHECQDLCSSDHKCGMICKEQCLQECSHARCKQYCSCPCAPCQESCAWKCPHYACPLPCGSVCARLPCDKRCERKLQCGHRCPSVCGEDCSIQICPRCAPRDTREKIVDLILYRNLEDIADDDETLDELLITIPKCKHVFTVETLDGLCGMSDYYIQSEIDGKWLDLASPVSQTASGERKKPPVCPTCRSVITSPRYGRVYKSANLDILERNIISRMSQQLLQVQELIEGISKSNIESNLSAHASGIKVDQVPCAGSVRKARTAARKALLNETRENPLPANAIQPENEALFSVSSSATPVWREAVKPLVQAYERVIKVAKMRSAHVSAWEAAWSCLCQQELELAASNPERAPRRPQEHAMRMARMKVGQPQPRADKRFLVEAFWASLKIRFIMADLALTWLKIVGKNRQNYAPQQCQMWAVYGTFLLDSCERDAQIALRIATATESRRQMTTTMLLVLRAGLERFRFEIVVAEESRTIAVGGEREKLADRASCSGQNVARLISTTIRDHLTILPDDGQGWIVRNFKEIATDILNEWNELEKSLSAATFYQPVSLDEKMAIIQAFSSEFGYTGHYYNCPNGHTFVIGDCGGAMQRANCPECGEAIGGSNHQLDGRNTHAMEFEELARAAGGQRSPWTWGV